MDRREIVKRAKHLIWVGHVLQSTLVLMLVISVILQQYSDVFAVSVFMVFNSMSYALLRKMIKALS